MNCKSADSVSNIAVSITALFSGIFIVVAGGLADRLGRIKLTKIGLALSMVGSLINRHLARPDPRRSSWLDASSRPLSCVHHARDASTS